MDDLGTYLDPTLPIPIAGVNYPVTCSAYQGLHLHKLFAEGINLTDAQERDEILHLLGDTYQRMVDDGLSWPKIAFAGRTAMLWFGHSPALATTFWERGGVPGNPLPPSPNQKVMGDKLRAMFQRREPMDRMIRAAANTTR